MTPEEQLLVEAAKRGLLPGRGATQPAQEGATLQEETAKTFGLEDLESRGTILPLGRTKEGELVPAVPQLGVDLMESVLLPKRVMRGEGFTQDEATRFSLDTIVPGSIGKGVGAARKAAPGLNKRELIESAPSVEGIKEQSRAFKTAATSSGTSVDPDTFADFLGGVETTVRMNKINPRLHPQSSAVFEAITKEVGNELDVEDLIIIRRLIGTAERTVAPELADDRRIAGIMRESLDDFVDNLDSKAGSDLTEFRKLWGRAKKTEIIEDVIERASIQASGFENGIRIGFRALLKDRKRIKGFTDAEKKLMKEIDKGTTKIKTLRLLGKLSFGTKGGSNFIGGSAGIGLGSFLGGPVGAVASPAIGLVAQKGADAATGASANLARAMAATGQAPKSLIERNLLADVANRLAAPVAGTQVPRPANALTINTPGVI